MAGLGLFIALQKPSAHETFTELSYVPNQVIVKFKSVGQTEGFEFSTVIDGFSQSHDLSQKDSGQDTDAYVLFELDGNQDVQEAIPILNNDPLVEYAQPNYKYELMDISSDDTYRGNLWGMDNTGQLVNGITGTIDADIDAPEAWANYEGESEIIVAVIDSGIKYDHPDLVANMWDGSSCLDHTGAPLGGCQSGYDFENDDLDPFPSISDHGTHVAGTLGAVKDNTTGVIGTIPNVKIMALRSSLLTSELLDAIDFAEQNGARVINASWAGPSNDTALRNAISDFPGIFVAAAANFSVDNDSLPYYPCSFDLDNVICVAATDQDDELASFSNYGANTVDLAAPGTNIFSTIALAESVHTSEDFSGVTVPGFPTDWSSTDTWESYAYDSDYAIRGDTVPYAQTADEYIDGPTVDLTGMLGASFSFFTECDTEYFVAGGQDYMSLEISADGTYTSPYDDELYWWDEALIDYYNSDLGDDSGTASRTFYDIFIPEDYLTSTFTFRFRWVADGDTDIGSSGEGCTIDNVRIHRYDDTVEEYNYFQGTSMSTPHVSGAVALLMDYSDGSMTDLEIKNHIINNVDPIPSLLGKMVSGGRLNLNNLLEEEPAPPVDSKPVYRFYSPRFQVHFYTISQTERDKLINEAPFNEVYEYEGVGFYAFDKSDCSDGRTEIYRFYRAGTNSHFFTQSESEKDKLINNPDFNTAWDYEGVAYCAYPTELNGSLPLYRWFGQAGAHFFTISESERTKLLTQSPFKEFWDYEGIAYYVLDQ